MLIILEGSDGTFKTSIGNHLSSELSIPVFKGSSFESALMPNDRLFEWYLSMLNNLPEHAIMDRFFYSNLVYAPLFKDYSVLTDRQVVYLENIIDSKFRKALVVHLTGDPLIISERVNTRGDKYVTQEHIGPIIDKYKGVMYRCSLPVFNIDTTRIYPGYASHLIMMELIFH
jgi:thymidylate kinase